MVVESLHAFFIVSLPDIGHVNNHVLKKYVFKRGTILVRFPHM